MAEPDQNIPTELAFGSGIQDETKIEPLKDKSHGTEVKMPEPKEMIYAYTESVTEEKTEELMMGQKDSEHTLLYTVLEKDQKIPAKCLVDKDEDSHETNKIDPDWKYNITIGDVEKWRIKTCTGKEEELWFPKDGSIRKVFIAFKVKRVSEVDNVGETYRMRFHIYFNWLATKEDYLAYCIAKEAAKEGDVDKLTSWEPKWYPHLEFQNAIEEHIREWEEYPEEGCFRIQTFSDFAKEKTDKIPKDQFDSSCAKFIRAKLECEMTFAEELELQAFPFDCQDLSCVIHERTTGGVRCVFLPELRNPNFASIDPRYSVIDEWDLETAMIEFGDADSNASRGGASYAMIVLRLKVKRRWEVFLWNIQFLMACICGLALTAFSLAGVDNLGNRLNLLITLILTAVAFTFVVFDNLPNVPYLTYMDKYILFSYGYLVALMVESAFINSVNPKLDKYFFFAFLAFWILYHVAFFFYALQIRKEEQLKLFFSSDEIEQEVNLLRPSLHFDYTKRLRSGNEGRLLSFVGMMAIPEAMSEDMREQFKKNQDRLEKLYEARSEQFRIAAERVHQTRKHDQMKQLLGSDKKDKPQAQPATKDGDEKKEKKEETNKKQEETNKKQEETNKKQETDKKMGDTLKPLVETKESEIEDKDTDIGVVGMGYMRNNTGI